MEATNEFGKTSDSYGRCIPGRISQQKNIVERLSKRTEINNYPSFKDLIKQKQKRGSSFIFKIIFFNKG
jgi:hypothetical protein